MLYVVNYAFGEPFESYRRISSRTAKWFGKADKVFEYTASDITQSYKKKHEKIFAYKRGAGLWLWKPYVILDALNKIGEGDWLFYLDSGTTIINDLHKVQKAAIQYNQDIVLFEQPLLSREFTKRECYIKLGMEDQGENQVLGLVLVKKTTKSVHFIEEWLHLCEREDMLSPKHFYPEIAEWDDFVAHREDQALLNLLRIKYQIMVFKDCSDYGAMPFMAAYKNVTFNPKRYLNSPYSVVILCNRTSPPWKYFVKYCIKRILYKIGIYYTEKRVLSHLPILNQ